MVVLGHSGWVQALSLKYLIVLGYVDAFLKRLVNGLSSQSGLWKIPCKAGGPTGN